MKRNKPRVGLWGRLMVLIVYVVCVSGCSMIPPVMSQVSWALSTVSYVTTSKGPSDHAISYVVQMDCSLFRIISFKPICRPVSENTNQSILSWIINKFRKPAADPVLSSSPQVAFNTAHFKSNGYANSDRDMTELLGNGSVKIEHIRLLP